MQNDLLGHPEIVNCMSTIYDHLEQEQIDVISVPLCVDMVSQIADEHL